MATIGGKIVTTNQSVTFVGGGAKQLLYTAPSAGITKVLFASTGMSGGSNVTATVYLRQKDPSVDALAASADVEALAISESGVFTFRELDYPTNGSNIATRLEGKYMIMLPGEQLRYTNTNGNTHYINFGTITQS